MVKIKTINTQELATGIEFMWSYDEGYEDFETPPVVEKLALLLISIKDALKNYENGEMRLARLSMICTDEWAKKAMDMLKGMEEEE